MFRLAPFVLALVAGVTWAPAIEAAPKPTKATKATTAKSKSTKSAKKKTADTSKKKAGKQTATKTSSKATAGKKAKGKKGKREARVPWKPNRRTLANTTGMPQGFSWPPTRAMMAAEQECEEKLDRAGVVWEKADAEGRIANPIYVPSMTFGGIKYVNQWGSKGPHKLDCQLALALETIGPELHAIGVREVRFGSLFRWSNVRSHGKTRPILSRHGIGLAMDIGAFVDESGRVANIKADYAKDDQLLLAIEEMINANGNFRIVLTPKNDPVSHDDHFHIEARADFSSPDVP